MRSLFLPLPLLLAPLAAPLIFSSPAEAAILPPCCVSEGASKPPHADPHEGPINVGAKVKRPDERALEATAEAPITADAPLVNAIGIPLDEEERRGVSEPEHVTAGVRIVTPPPPLAPNPDIEIDLPPCCRAEAHSKPPHPENPPPVLVAAKVKSPDERALQAAAEAPVAAEAPPVNAIGIPLSAQRGVSEPAMSPAPVTKAADVDNHDASWRWLDPLRANAAVAMALLLVMAVGFMLSARRRKPRPEPFLSLTGSPRPDAPAPQFEPEVAHAKARHAERERESA